MNKTRRLINRGVRSHLLSFIYIVFDVYTGDLISHLLPKWRQVLLILTLFFSGDGWPSVRDNAACPRFPTEEKQPPPGVICLSLGVSPAGSPRCLCCYCGS